jgi:hypothetical protein
MVMLCSAHPAVNFAYIVPAVEVLRDLSSRVGYKVSVLADAPSSPSPLHRSRQPLQGESDGCELVFSTRKDLIRHVSTVHEETDPAYMCRCGFAQRRKDLYRRHLARCNRQRQRHDYYTCICGLNHSDYDFHIVHVVNCGRVRRGRLQGGARKRQPTRFRNRRCKGVIQARGKSSSELTLLSP